MDKERKYELLPGVELPDIDAIKHAASDFSASGIDSVEVKAHAPRIMPDGHPDAATSEEMRRMQALGDQIAADRREAGFGEQSEDECHSQYCCSGS
ncbi:MAG: hypothetical protein LKM40_06930 [Mageeibacillus sp.]|jgi:hypothetical protein|nr:hypothetical protein [Mageeibacillus sp.]